MNYQHYHEYHRSTDSWSRVSISDSQAGESSGASRPQQQPTRVPSRASDEETSPSPSLRSENCAATPIKNRDDSHSPLRPVTSITMPQYTSRDVGDPSQIKKNKQSMADLKLRRLTELNTRLREDLDRERIPVSQAAKR